MMSLPWNQGEVALATEGREGEFLLRLAGRDAVDEGRKTGGFLSGLGGDGFFHNEFWWVL